MNEYRCCECGRTFYDPLPIKEHVPGGDTLEYEVCPYCKETGFIPIEECPDCTNMMPEGNVLCASCRAELRRKLLNFLTGLTPAEREMLDAWTTECSILDLMGDEDDD